MDKTTFYILGAVVFCLQLGLCLGVKRVWVRLVPTLLLAATILGCSICYAISSVTNWGFLILAVVLLPVLALDGVAWLSAWLLRRRRNVKKSKDCA